MLTPQDILIEKHTYQNGDIEYHLMVRIFETRKIRLFKSEIVPIENFKLYTEVDAEGFCWVNGKYTGLDGAREKKEELLIEYYHSLPHQTEYVK